MNEYTSKTIRGITLTCHSHWNNSMGFDECSAVIFEDGEFKTVYVEADAWYHVDTNAFVSETPEHIRQLYADLKEKERAEAKAKADREEAEHNARLCGDCLLTLDQVNTIRRIYDWNNQDKIFHLLSTKTFRSTFRKSLADQVRKWLGEEKPQYQTPLSARQLAHLR